MINVTHETTYQLFNPEGITVRELIEYAEHLLALGVSSYALVYREEGQAGPEVARELSVEISREERVDRQFTNPNDGFLEQGKPVYQGDEH